MSYPPVDSVELGHRLLQLTQRQCQILYWVCHGMSYKEVGRQIDYGQDLVQKEMSELYRQLGLTRLPTKEKRRILEQTICPLHETFMSNPATDCKQRPIAVNDPDPVPQAMIEVIQDEANGLVPLTPTKSLIRVSQSPTGPGSETDRTLRSVGPVYPRTAVIPPNRPTPLPWILVGVLGALLAAAVCAIGFLMSQQLQPTPQPPIVEALATTTPSRVVQVVPPTLMAPTVVRLPTPVPIPTVVNTPTPSDQQIPPPGSIIAAGESYSRKGVTITLRKKLAITSCYFDFNLLDIDFEIQNQTGQPLFALFKSSYFHLRDDKRKEYRPNNYGDKSFDSNRQLTIPVDEPYTFSAACHGAISSFNGPIDASAKYLVITVDQLLGLSNMNWKYELVP